MKQLIIFLILFIAGNNSFAQITDSSNCLQYHRGKFSFTDSLGNVVLVDRKKRYQYQVNQVTRVREQFRIKWINLCQYELTLVSTNSRSSRKNKFAVATTIISKTFGEAGYEYNCSCKDAELRKITGVMKKIKD